MPRSRPDIVREPLGSPGLVLIFVLLLGVCLCPARDARAQKKGLARVEDFVVVSGKDLAGLLGAEAGSLRLYSCRGSCKQVPAQVDKVDALGRYVFPQDKNKDRDGSLLDQNDEIAFMAGDAGDKAPAGFRPQGAVRGVEIELIDPLDSGAAWLYLFDMPGVKPSSGLPDYVDYKVEDGSVFIQSPQFVLGYKQGRINYDHLRLRSASGALCFDLLDRQRVGLEGKMAGDRNITLSAPESIIKVNDIAVIDGPVRVIVDEVMSVHIGVISFQYGSELFMTFYRCGQNNSVNFSFPAAASTLFKSILFYWSLDFTPDVVGFSYIDANHPEPIVVKNETRQSIPGDKPHFWWGMYGPKGAVLQALKLDNDITPYFTCDGRWNQDPDGDDKKGDFPGRLEIGFSCHEKGKIPEKQDYHWQNYILFPADPTAAGLTSLKNIFEKPLAVKTGPLP